MFIRHNFPSWIIDFDQKPAAARNNSLMPWLSGTVKVSAHSCSQRWSQKIKIFAHFMGFHPSWNVRTISEFFPFFRKILGLLCPRSVVHYLPSPVTVTSLCPTLFVFIRLIIAMLPVMSLLPAPQPILISICQGWGCASESASESIVLGDGPPPPDRVCFADCLQLMRNPLTVGHICAFAES